MPLSPVRLFTDDRLKVPDEHLGVLVVPEAAQQFAILNTVAAQPFHAVRLLDTTVRELRTALRSESGCPTPLIVTGHQPELFHAGVLAKTIAAALLAERCGGQAVFVTVDSDLPRQTHLPVPQVTSRGLRRVEVVIPGCDRQMPYEFQPRATRAEWLQFFASVTSLHEFGDRSLLPLFARAWLTVPEAQPAWCDALARANAAAGAALGLPTVRELRLSRLCGTSAFRVFAAHLILNAGRCAALYNAALAAYRQRHRVRSSARPMPALMNADGRVELPLWVVHADQARRRLFVTSDGRTVTLHADQIQIARMSAAELSTVDRHQRAWELEETGWQLRPRAVMLSAFLRLLLADLFIHGIGGARYDEVTEEFAAAFFGAALPPLACVSATVRLPLPCHGVRADDIARARQAARDLRYNPQRHLRDLPAKLVRRREELVRRSVELRQNCPHDRAARRVVFRELRRLNERLLEYDPWRAAAYDQRIQTLVAQMELDRIALDREYFYALHPQTTLAELVEVLRQRMG